MLLEYFLRLAFLFRHVAGQALCKSSRLSKSFLGRWPNLAENGELIGSEIQDHELLEPDSEISGRDGDL